MIGKELNINSKIKLNNGIEIPRLGLGTYRITSQKEVNRAIHSAFDCGYRLIDTASAYGNEREIGNAIKEYPIDREEIFITTKLGNTDHGYEAALKAFDESLRKLNCDYIDLYLIHWPVKGRIESWKAMEKLLEQGKCKSIGVSNFMISHLEQLLQNTSVIPAVNQIEFNPFMYDTDVYNYCINKNIIVEAYTPITKDKRFSHKVIKQLSKKYEKTPAQIMLRWSLQKDVVVIPKSSNPKRIKENAEIFDFEIEKEDMEKLDFLDEKLRSSPDPYNFI